MLYALASYFKYIIHHEAFLYHNDFKPSKLECNTNTSLMHFFGEKTPRNLTDKHLHSYAMKEKQLLLQCAIMECLIKTVMNNVENV